jgi:hypothetical protein
MLSLVAMNACAYRIHTTIMRLPVKKCCNISRPHSELRDTLRANPVQEGLERRLRPLVISRQQPTHRGARTRRHHSSCNWHAMIHPFEQIASLAATQPHIYLATTAQHKLVV